MLCKSCEKTRFHTDYNPNQENPERGDTSHNNKGQASNGPGKEEKGVYVRGPIVQPLLAYIAFSMNSGSTDSIKRAVLGHFSTSQINDAKDVVWSEKIADNLLGTRTKRRNTSARSETEANVQDIIDALKLLDRDEKMPLFVVDYLSLSIIPRSHPEELNDISLCDRLNRLEEKMSNLQQGLDRTVAENIDIKDKLAQMNKSSPSIVKPMQGRSSTASSAEAVISAPVTTYSSHCPAMVKDRSFRERSMTEKYNGGSSIQSAQQNQVLSL